MDPSSGDIHESLQQERIKCENGIDNSSGCDKKNTNISSLYELLQEREQETQCNNDSASGDYQELIRQQQKIYEELKYKSTESKSTVDDFEMTEEFIQEQQRMYEEITSNQHHTSIDSSSSQTRRNSSSYSEITSDTYEAPSSSSTSKTSKATKKSLKNAPVLSDIVPENEVIIREIFMI
jgi:ketol-acid reductoisomerase